MPIVNTQPRVCTTFYATRPSHQDQPSQQGFLSKIKQQLSKGTSPSAASGPEAATVFLTPSPTRTTFRILPVPASAGSGRESNGHFHEYPQDHKCEHTPHAMFCPDCAFSGCSCWCWCWVLCEEFDKDRESENWSASGSGSAFGVGNELRLRDGFCTYWRCICI